MLAKKQPRLPGFEGLDRKTFGGSLHGRGNPREARPVAIKRPMHVVIRSTAAKGARSFLSPGRARPIENLVRAQGRALGVRVYKLANSGNHLHLVVLPISRRALVAFLRAISGLIARLILRAERGSPSSLPKFWDARPFTRILEWGRDFRRTLAYLEQNALEALGFLPGRISGTRPSRP